MCNIDISEEYKYACIVISNEFNTTLDTSIFK